MILRLICWVVLIVLSGGCAASSVSKVTLFTGHDSRQVGIELKGTLDFREQSYYGEMLSELSGIAWDEDESILYAVSDEGVLFHIRPQIRNGHLIDAKVIAAWPLKDKEGMRLTGKWSDSEGLDIVLSNNAVRGDTQLVVAFEGRPRIVRYSIEGVYLNHIDLPDILEDRKKYHSSNKALESVTVHPAYGVITTPEYPLKNAPGNIISVFSSHGKAWRIPRSHIENVAVVAIESSGDGSVLVLQRAYKSPLHPLTILLSRVILDEHCELTRPGSTDNLCARKDLAILSTARGWALDNFEGLTHYKENTFLMVSDNNGKGIQRTLLTFFQLL